MDFNFDAFSDDGKPSTFRINNITVTEKEFTDFHDAFSAKQDGKDDAD